MCSSCGTVREQGKLLLVRGASDCSVQLRGTVPLEHRVVLATFTASGRHHVPLQQLWQ
jgi:hypothetical protein